MREGILPGGLPFLSFGDGEPLVVLPGLGGEDSNATGLARRFAVRPLRALARHFTVYLIGRGGDLARVTTLGDVAQLYAGAIERELGDAVPVMGESTGGSIAQQLAIDHPPLVRRLVLADTAYRLSPRGRELQARYARLVASGQIRQAHAVLGPALAATPLGARLMTALMWLLGPRMRPSDPSNLLAIIAAEDRFDCSASLHQIRAPTLLLAGDRDAFYSPELFRKTAAAIPDARLLLYPRKAHGVGLVHAPARRAILEFLTQN